MEDKLPFELWLEILSYIPRRHHRRLIGVNRVLFEHALDEIYKEIELVHDDENTLFTFTRLKNVDITKRVQRLVLRPTFMPNELAVLPQIPPVGEPKSPGTSKKRFSWFNKSKRSSFVTTDQLYEPKASSDILLDTAQRVIPHCLNLWDLHIIINVEIMQLSSSLETFFQSLWQPKSILPRIRKLTMDGSPYALSQLILPISLPSHLWTNLNNLDLTIHPHYSPSTLNHLHLSTFLGNLKDYLISLTLSGPMDPSIAQVLGACPKFSRLSCFNLYSIFNNQNMSQMQQLNLFLETHSKTLEKITISPQIRTDSSNISNYSYIHWLTFVGTDRARGQTFSQISLPELTTLEISYGDRWINGPIYHRVVFPNLSFIAPNLTALSILHTELSLDRVSELLALLPHRNGACLLESISLSIDILSPELIDLLSATLAGLSSLTLRLSRYVLRSDLEQYIFYKIIQERRYPAWRLRHICIVSSSSCGIPHANIQAMTAVARTLATPPTLDLTYSCQCYKS